MRQTDWQKHFAISCSISGLNIILFPYIDIVKNSFKSFYRRKLLKVLSSCYKKSDEGTLVQNFLVDLSHGTKIYLDPSIPNTWKFPNYFLSPSSVCLFSITTFSTPRIHPFHMKIFQKLPSLVWKWWHWMTRPD